MKLNAVRTPDDELEHAEREHLLPNGLRAAFNSVKDSSDRTVRMIVDLMLLALEEDAVDELNYSVIARAIERTPSTALRAITERLRSAIIEHAVGHTADNDVDAVIAALCAKAMRDPRPSGA